MARVGLVLVLLTLVSVCYALRPVSVDVSADPAEIQYTLVSGGVERTFYMYVPSRYNTSTNDWPIMFFFHGATDACTSGANHMIAGFTAEQATRDFLMVAGCGISNLWNTSVDLPFAQAMLEALQKEYRLDADRTYASGFSLGAALIEYIGCYSPGLFSGLAAVSGGLSVKGSNLSNRQVLQACDSAVKQTGDTVPMLMIQGSEDPVAHGSVYGATGSVSMRDDFYGWALRNGCTGSPTAVQETTVLTDEQFENCPTAVKNQRLIFLLGFTHEWVVNATFNHNQAVLNNYNIVATQLPARNHKRAHNRRIARKH